MGIELILEEENGKELARVNDLLSLVQEFLPDVSNKEFSCLRFVDPYGDTIFNRLQLPVLLHELQVTLKDLREPQVAQHLSEIIVLVARAQNSVHTYVRFVGD